MCIVLKKSSFASSPFIDAVMHFESVSSVNPVRTLVCVEVSTFSFRLTKILAVAVIDDLTAQLQNFSILTCLKILLVTLVTLRSRFKMKVAVVAEFI